MKLRYIVDVDVETEDEENTARRIGSEIQSNLESVDVDYDIGFRIHSVDVSSNVVAPEPLRDAQTDDYDWTVYDANDTMGVSCPSCGGEGCDLGRLGSLQWFRCRDCGIDFNRQTKDRT